MQKSVPLAALILGYTLPVFAIPSFFPSIDSLKNNPSPTQISASVDVDFSGRWIGRCEGDTVNSDFIIQQTPDSVSMIFGKEKIRFMINGVSSNDRFNQDVVYQEKYVADWDSQNHALRLKMLHWGHGYGGFELTLSQLILNVNNNHLFIQNTHNALFAGFEDFQSGKSNCIYDRV